MARKYLSGLGSGREPMASLKFAAAMALKAGLDPVLTLIEAAVSESRLGAFLGKQKKGKQKKGKEKPWQEFADFIRESDTLEPDSSSPFASPTLREYLSKARRGKRLGLDLLGLDEIAKATALTPRPGGPRVKPFHEIAFRAIKRTNSARLECYEITQAASREVARENRRGETTLEVVLNARLQKEPRLVESILKKRPYLCPSRCTRESLIPTLVNALVVERRTLQSQFGNDREIKRRLGLGVTKRGSRKLRSLFRKRAKE